MGFTEKLKPPKKERSKNVLRESLDSLNSDFVEERKAGLNEIFRLSEQYENAFLGNEQETIEALKNYKLTSEDEKINEKVDALIEKLKKMREERKKEI